MNTMCIYYNINNTYPNYVELMLNIIFTFFILLLFAKFDKYKNTTEMNLFKYFPIFPLFVVFPLYVVYNI